MGKKKSKKVSVRLATTSYQPAAAIQPTMTLQPSMTTATTALLPTHGPSSPIAHHTKHPRTTTHNPQPSTTRHQGGKKKAPTKEDLDKAVVNLFDLEEYEQLRRDVSLLKVVR